LQKSHFIEYDSLSASSGLSGTYAVENQYDFTSHSGFDSYTYAEQNVGSPADTNYLTDSSFAYDSNTFEEGGTDTAMTFESDAESDGIAGSSLTDAESSKSTDQSTEIYNLQANGDN
jgi:hypothetical protein